MTAATAPSSDAAAGSGDLGARSPERKAAGTGLSETSDKQDTIPKPPAFTQNQANWLATK